MTAGGRGVETQRRVEPDAPVALDVVYLVDGTGSMVDEIELLKATLDWVAGEIGNWRIGVDLRTGYVVYRDRDQEYLAQKFGLSADIDRMGEQVSGATADGGGDKREGLNEGLHEAVRGMEWRDDAVKLVFLVADAEPHLDYEHDPDYAEEMVWALERGIKVHTVATSGLDEFGEYVFRQIAQHTMGKFVFLVYGGMSSHDLGDQFSEEHLDRLVVSLVQRELLHLQR